MHSKEKTFRGLHFDLKKETVKSAEIAKPEAEYDDYLRYNLLADSVASGESLELEYFFNKKDQLDLIIAFYNTGSSEVINSVIDELKDYFENRYGTARKDENGFYHWEFDDKGEIPGTIEIHLTGETEEGYMGIEIELLKYYQDEKKLATTKGGSVQ